MSSQNSAAAIPKRWAKLPIPVALLFKRFLQEQATLIKNFIGKGEIISTGL